MAEGQRSDSLGDGSLFPGCYGAVGLGESQPDGAEPVISRKQILLLVALLGGFFAFLAWQAPLKDALLIGPDDKFELDKAQFLERKPELVDRLWNDQPWLYTLVIAKAFALFGENAAIPRMFTLLCTLAIVLACWHLIGRKATVLEWVLLPCFYFTSAEVTQLACSAMVEPCTMAFAVIAVACAYSPDGQLPAWRGYTAGLLMSVAVWIKLTALMIAPAWLAFLVAAYGLRGSFRLLPRLALGFLIGTVLVVIVSPPFSFDSIWLTHQRAHEIAALKGERAFHITTFFSDWSMLFAVVLALLRFVRERPRTNFATVFAGTWLVTDFAIHLWHRPWFSYYAIHFQIPLAILAAQGVAWALSIAWRAAWERRMDSTSGANKLKFAPEVRASLAGLTAAFLVACWFGIRFPTYWDQVETVHNQGKAIDNVFVEKIRSYADRANWIYCGDNEVAFHGGVLQPPELIIMSYKRLALGSLGKEKIFRIVEQYQPELMLLRKKGEETEAAWTNYLARGRYVKVMWNGNEDLWASPRLRPIPAKRPQELITKLGL